MNKQVIRLTEDDLHKIIKESVNKILKKKSVNEINGLHGNSRKDWHKLLKQRTKQADDANYEVGFLDDIGDIACPGDLDRARTKLNKIERAAKRDDYYAHGGKSYISKK